MLIWAGVKLRFNVLELRHLLFQLFYFFAQPFSLGLGDLGRCPIRRIHRRKIAVNALLDLLHARLDLALGKVAVAVIHGFEFAAVNGDDRLGEEIEVAAKHYELPADAANGFTVVSAKVGNRFEVCAMPHAQAGGC